MIAIVVPPAVAMLASVMVEAALVLMLVPEAMVRIGAVDPVAAVPFPGVVPARRLVHDLAVDRPGIERRRALAEHVTRRAVRVVLARLCVADRAARERAQRAAGDDAGPAVVASGGGAADHRPEDAADDGAGRGAVLPRSDAVGGRPAFGLVAVALVLFPRLLRLVIALVLGRITLGRRHVVRAALVARARRRWRRAIAVLRPGGRDSAQGGGDGQGRRRGSEHVAQHIDHSPAVPRRPFKCAPREALEGKA